MNKDEFIQGLREALSGELPPASVRENLRYYEEYIRTEMGKGRTEGEIMEELGSPRLIARTIIDTTPGAEEGAYEEYDSGSGTRQSPPHSQPQGGSFRYYDLNKWYWKLLGIVIVIIALTLVLMVVGGILSLVIPMLPAIGLVILILWFVRGSSGPGER